jgi:predicted metal-dependent hydrolase|tara:strand:+ start:32824 stop:33570 length:747 start_codon:yes stop_codon:yes gene_type:complete
MPNSENNHLALKVATRVDPLEIKVNQSRGMRYLKVTVNSSGDVVLNIPYGVSRENAVAFLDEQKDWIATTLEKVEPKISLYEYLTEHPMLSALGREQEVTLREASRGGFEFKGEEGKVVLNALAEESCDTILLRSLRAFAGEVIPLQATDFARRHGLNFSRISVRDQRSRWGSCSERGTLSFNWRMVLLPAAHHDYLIWHELSHLVQMNHSPDFWHQVSVFDPEYEAHDAAITNQYHTLMGLGRTIEA